MLENYQGLRAAYLALSEGARFIWIDRCYILALLQEKSTPLTYSPQWCIARGYYGGSVQNRPLGDKALKEVAWFPKLAFDSENARKVILRLRTDTSLHYNSDSVLFNLIGQPAYLKKMEGLSRVESWGRWSNSRVAPQVTLEYRRPLPHALTLRLTAKAYGHNVGQPVTIQIGNEKQTVTFGATPSTITRQFSNSSGAKTIVITPPHPELDMQEGNWTPLDNAGRLIGVGLIELQVTPAAD